MKRLVSKVLVTVQLRSHQNNVQLIFCTHSHIHVQNPFPLPVQHVFKVIRCLGISDEEQSTLPTHSAVRLGLPHHLKGFLLTGGDRTNHTSHVR